MSLRGHFQVKLKSRFILGGIFVLGISLFGVRSGVAGEDLTRMHPYDPALVEAAPVGMEQASLGINPCPDGEIENRVIADGGESFIFSREFGKNGVPELKELQAMSQDELNHWYFDRLMQQFAQRKTWLSAGYDLCRPDGAAVGFNTPLKGVLHERASLVKLEGGALALKTSYNGTVVVHCCMPKK